MSLCCAECYNDMQPSDSLPGREGAMVHPVVMSIVYDKEDKPHFRYLEVRENRSLCLECVEKKMPDERKTILKPIYEAYGAETEYRSLEEEFHAQSRECGGIYFPSDEKNEAHRSALERFVEKSKQIEKECIYCGHGLGFGIKSNSHFIAAGLDKAYSMQNTSPFWGSYQWSNMREGGVAFKICYSDFSEKFPNAFEQLISGMLGINPEIKSMQSEFWVAPEIEKLLKEEGITMNDLAKKLGPGIQIVRRVD